MGVELYWILILRVKIFRLLLFLVFQKICFTYMFFTYIIFFAKYLLLQFSLCFTQYEVMVHLLSLLYCNIVFSSQVLMLYIIYAFSQCSSHLTSHALSSFPHSYSILSHPYVIVHLCQIFIILVFSI